ncbi:MAG: helix-turn-helix domain-containing protein [Gemmatimonadaceae bacterium]|nr:helix-turn-helix domain-containing protein [Gemmatimonadaceae bacterium]
MLERHHFAQDLASGHWTMTELCDRYGISRNTGYKWLHRFDQEGCGRAPGAEPGAAILADGDARRGRRADSRGAHPLRLGRAEDLEAPAYAGPQARLAGAECGLRHSRSPRSRAETAESDAVETFRRRGAPHVGPEPGVDD